MVDSIDCFGSSQSPSLLDDLDEEEQNRNRLAVQALKLGFDLAIKERDFVIQQYEDMAATLEQRNFLTNSSSQFRPADTPDSEANNNATSIYNQFGPPPSSPFIPVQSLVPNQLNTLTMSSPKLNNRFAPFSHFDSFTIFETLRTCKLRAIR